MRTLREWLYKKYLPKVTREIYEKEMNDLRMVIDIQKREIENLNSYIDGMNHALRSQRRIIIKNEVKHDNES